LLDQQINMMNRPMENKPPLLDQLRDKLSLYNYRIVRYYLD